ncbi:hypothetical protein GCM10027594_12710 [Hymenobacter agri]
MRKILLASYAIEIYQGSEAQHPAKFGGNVDLLSLFHDFAQHVLKETQHLPHKRGTSHRFTYASHTLPVLNDSTRDLYGYFNAGRDGDDFTANKYNADGTLREQKRITRDMHNMRDSFFYLKVPKELGKRRAYLILQQPEGEGIKGLVFVFFNEYLKLRGLQNFRAIFLGLIPEKVFTGMMQNGNFKELTLTSYKLPDIVEGTGNDEEMIPKGRGTMKVMYQATDLGSRFKSWATRYFHASRKADSSAQKSRVTVAIGDESKEYDEVSMKLELNGKEKTFHLARGSRTQPDIDVGGNVEDDAHGRPRLDQLLEQAREIVADVSLELPRDASLPDPNQSI